MTDPTGFLAAARAQFLSEDVEEQLTARAHHGYRPLVAILHKARLQAADAMAALVSANPEKPGDIRALQNEVRRFEDLVQFTQAILGEGQEHLAIHDEDRRELENLIFSPIRETTAEQAVELQRLGMTRSDDAD